MLRKPLQNINLTQHKYNFFETLIIKLSINHNLKDKLMIMHGKHINNETGFPSYAIVEYNKKPVCALYNDKFILLNSMNFSVSEQKLIKILADELVKAYEKR